MNSKRIFLITALMSILFCQQRLVYAQNFGVEIGTAGVENFDAGVLNLGFSIRLPLHQKAFCELSYNHWQGEDGNYKHAQNNQQDLIDCNYFGNSGINLSIFYKIYRTNKFAISIGPGLGRYQMLKLNQSDEKEYFYQSTLSLSTILSYQFSEFLAIYGKVLINTSTLEIDPDWGLFNVGIELSPFK